MQQTVLIGLGGTGSRVVNNVARELHKNKHDINDGIITCVVLDTNQSDNELIENSGTNVPVIPTCDEMTIDRYIARYQHKNPLRWCPYSLSFGTESMINGASEIRAKSRLAFMDTMETSKINLLEEQIERVFLRKEGRPEQIRVLLVTSLSGGTGSGMFIQVALWLRQFFNNHTCQATIRGVFLLPDVFVKTIDNIKNNPRKKLYHYANAYAAIRELNAIDKLSRGKKTEFFNNHIVIDDLFDSNHPTGRQVFDNAFFIDAVDENGASLKSIEAYEKTVAQIVYMQLFAPMYNELYSVEDNLYRVKDACPEPVYGSAGTAKLVYPIDDIKEYMALRATAGSLQECWNEIDDDIESQLENQQEQIDRGIKPAKLINKKELYVELFKKWSDKKSYDAESATEAQRLLVSIAHDIDDENIETDKEGNEKSEFIDKCSTTFTRLETAVSNRIKSKGYLDSLNHTKEKLSELAKKGNPKSKGPGFKAADIRVLKGMTVSSQLSKMKTIVETIQEDYRYEAGQIMWDFLPFQMDKFSKPLKQMPDNFFSLFVKKHPKTGAISYVHPIAARCLLYKMKLETENKRNSLNVVGSLEAALTGDQSISADDPRTVFKKETFDQYWQQTGPHYSNREITHFIKQFKLLTEANLNLCVKYAFNQIYSVVLDELDKVVDYLIEQFENIFKGLKDTSIIAERISNNIDRNDNSNGMSKELFVCADLDNKERLFRALGQDFTKSVSELNETVIKLAYGKLCYSKRPKAESNQMYSGDNFVEQLVDRFVGSFKRVIDEHSSSFDYDAIQAIFAESDYKFEKSQANKKSRSSDDAKSRHDSAVRAYKDTLDRRASPFLIAEPDEEMLGYSANAISDGKAGRGIYMTSSDSTTLYMPFQHKLVFWGFNPELLKSYSNLPALIGANALTASNNDYSRYQLCCYKSSYCIRAEKIPKFNEMKNGEYYVNYSAVIAGLDAPDGNETDNPHIDKTWHNVLPFISENKRKEAEANFYKSIWYAIAYGRISLSDGEYYFAEKVEDVYGGTHDRPELLLNGGKSIRSVEIDKLIAALRQYRGFETIIAKQLSTEYKEDLLGINKIEDSKLLKGLQTKGDLNPATIILRYTKSKKYEHAVFSQLIGALEKVLEETDDYFNPKRAKDSKERAMAKNLYGIYTNGWVKQDGNGIFEKWLTLFNKAKLQPEEESTATKKTKKA